MSLGEAWAAVRGRAERVLPSWAVEPGLGLAALLPLMAWLALWGALNAGPWPKSPGALTFEDARGLLPIAVTLVVGSALVAWSREARPWPAALTPLAILGGYAAVALLATLLVSPGRRESGYWGLAFLGPLLACAWAVRGAGSLAAARRLVRVNWSIVVGVMLVLFTIGLVVYGLGRLPSLVAQHRLFGTAPPGVVPALWINANGAGRFAAVGLLLAAAMLLRARRWAARLPWLGLAAVAALLVVYTMSRSTLAGLALALPLLVFLERGPRATLAMLVGGLAVVVASGKGSAVLDYAVRTGAAGDVASVGGRTGIWDAVLREFWGSPVIGLGFHADRILLAQQVQDAWLHALLQAGILGTAFFVAAWALGWLGLWRLGLRRRFLGLAPEHRAPLVEASVVLAFLTVRSVSESTGAFFGVDLLLLVPLLVYVHAVWAAQATGAPDPLVAWLRRGAQASRRGETPAVEPPAGERPSDAGR
ncbi:MAG: hypothetical protein LC624_07995 [Halobacteriales archaeon]|nr:hypothetical protein [Halobacteriales archaeon]